MADVAQLVRASGCGSEGRGFKTHHSPQKIPVNFTGIFLFNYSFEHGTTCISQ